METKRILLYSHQKDFTNKAQALYTKMTATDERWDYAHIDAVETLDDLVATLEQGYDLIVLNLSTLNGVIEEKLFQKTPNTPVALLQERVTLTINLLQRIDGVIKTDDAVLKQMFGLLHQQLSLIGMKRKMLQTGIVLR